MFTSLQGAEHMMDGWGFGMGLGWLVWIAVIVLIVVLVVRVMQGSRRSRAEESPLDILKRRYARGEIDRDEFEAKKRDLQ